jgi:nucleotide-binding universal stress UspA family protein
MIEPYNRLGLKLENVLMATDFSAASKTALVYGAALAHRHHSRLLVVHVSSSQANARIMDAWRTLQSEMTDLLLAGRLAGVEQKLLVESGEIREVLSRLVGEYGVDMVVLGTRGRTGLWKFLMGSSAESIMQHVSCPVLTVGPNFLGEISENGPRRILVPTGFAPQSVFAAAYASWLAERLQSSLALLHVVADVPPGQDAERLKSERLERLREMAFIEQHNRVQPELMVEFGPVTERVLDIAARWKADLIVLGVHSISSKDSLQAEATWAKASEIVHSASCPVLTVRLPA